MFKVAEDLMQMIFITIDEKETENVNETEFTGCYSGCVGSCLNVCSGSGKGSTGTGW